jgi:hypothetical protein
MGDSTTPEPRQAIPRSGYADWSAMLDSRVKVTVNTGERISVG